MDSSKGQKDLNPIDFLFNDQRNKNESYRLKQTEPLKSENVYKTSHRQYYEGINQVLVYKYQKRKPIYYIPVYVRANVTRVHDINYTNSSAQIQCQLRIWLKIGEFPQTVQNQIVNQAILRINCQDIALQNIREPAKLDSSAIVNKSVSVAGFVFSKRIRLNITSDTFWAPFELIKMVTQLQIRKIILGNGNQQFYKQLSIKQKQQYWKAAVQFNFIDSHPFLQFSFKEVRYLGSFDIAQKYVGMQFNNQPINNQQTGTPVFQQDQQDVKILLENYTDDTLSITMKIALLRAGQITPQAYQHGQIVIPLYKFPGTTIINIFLPFYTIAVASLGVFFQRNNLTGSIANLASFCFAYIAFLPTIRQNLPKTPQLVLAEILIYIQILCSLLCFFYTSNAYITKIYQTNIRDQPVFIVALILTILNILTVTILMIIHKLIWEKRYNTLPKGSHKYIDCQSMNTDNWQQWSNQPCQKQFQLGMSLGFIKPYVLKKRDDLVMGGIKVEDLRGQFTTPINIFGV